MSLTSGGPTRAPLRALALAIGALEAALLLVSLGAFAVGRYVGLWFLLFLAVTAGVGWLLAVRVPTNPIGWMLLAVAGGFLACLPLELLGEALLDAQPGLAAWLLWLGAEHEGFWLWIPLVGMLVTQLLLRFPDGHLPSRGWRPLSWATIAVIVVSTLVLAQVEVDVAPGIPSPAGWLPLDPEAVTLAYVLALLVCSAGCVYSMVWRYRRSGEEARNQIKWVALAGGLTVAGFATTFGTFVLIPLSIGVAVLKYRLYDIDRIVSRTVSYAVVSVVVLATYALVVTSASRLLPASGALPVAGATLAAAGVFLPVLRRVRAAVDRRFDRERFDADREVEAFAARMGTAVDTEQVTGELTGAIARTLAPSSVGVWLNGGA